MKLLDLGDLTRPSGPRHSEADMLGVQISPGLVRGAIAQGGGLLERQERTFATSSRPDEVMEAVVTVAQSLLASPRAVGLAIPGEVDGSGRCWGLHGVPGFDGVYIAEELAARLGCPVAIESDGNAAALAERAHGRARSHPSALTLLLGERLAAGLVLEGELRRGSSGFGAALGHLCIDTAADARQCGCGRRGCLAAYVKLAAPADAAATGAALGAGLSLVQNMLDLDAIVLVCPTSEWFRSLEPAVRQALRQRVFGQPASELPLLDSMFGPDGVLIGAAALAERVGAPPASR